MLYKLVFCTESDGNNSVWCIGEKAGLDDEDMSVMRTLTSHFDAEVCCDYIIPDLCLPTSEPY